MLSLSAEAVALANEKNLPIQVGSPCMISGCCFDIVERPEVSLGVPKNAAGYSQRTIDGVTVYVPHGFPDDAPLVIRTRSLFGFRQLVIDGWRLA